LTVLRKMIAGYPPASSAVDWGAGRGDLTAALLERFARVFAVEPSAAMRAELERNCPRAEIVPGTIASASPPDGARFAIASHVLYHVADHKWGAFVVRAASRLARDGVLVVVLQSAEAECNRMLEHFGAPRFDLARSLVDTVRSHPELDFSFSHRPMSVVTASFEETLEIARFLLCDRDEDAFSRQVGEAEFRDYVRQHFWREAAGRGGWRHDEVYCQVRCNSSFGGR
jgi:methyltransferase family protein